MTGSQSGSVMSATSTSPVCTRAISEALRTTRAGPAPILWPMLRPVASIVERRLSAKRWIVRPLRLCTVSGPRLQDEDLAAGAVFAPLDVHRAAVVLLDDERLARERHDVGIVQGEALPLGARHVHGCDALRAALGVDHLDGLAAEVLADDRVLAGAQRGLVDVELIGIDRALHDGLAEAVSGRDEHDVAKARIGIEREHDARSRRRSLRTMCCTPAESAIAA